MNTNFMSSRHVKKENTSLPVDVRRSKTSLLKLPIGTSDSAAETEKMCVIFVAGNRKACKSFELFFSLRRVKKLTPVKLLLGRNGNALPRLENLISFGLRRQQSTLISSLPGSTLSDSSV